VAGIAATIRAFNPALGALEVVRLLKETARRPTAAWETELGWGIVDAGTAVDVARRVDRVAPASRVSVPRRTRGRTVVLRRAGADPPGRPGLLPSGVARYEVLRSTGGRRAVRIAATRRARLRVRVRPGRRYCFWTVAVDRAGNREAPPARPDATVRVRR
jgi:hypothetical protein